MILILGIILKIAKIAQNYIPAKKIALQYSIISETPYSGNEVIKDNGTTLNIHSAVQIHLWADRSRHYIQANQ